MEMVMSEAMGMAAVRTSVEALKWDTKASPPVQPL